MPMAFSFAAVCAASYAYYIVPVEHPYFPYGFNIVMLSVLVAKCFYFSALGKLLGAKIPMGKIYIWITAIYSILSVYFFTQVNEHGLGAYFDLSAPELSGLPLRERLLPYEIRKLVKVLFLPNYFLGFVFYCYLAFLAYKRRERVICFGVVFTIFSILYTNSYHVFRNEYWIPLNIVADLFELLRLHWVQKEKLASKVEEYNKELESVSVKLKEFEETEKEMQVFRHDLNNDLYISSLNLQKAQLYLKGLDMPVRAPVEECLDNALKAQFTVSKSVKHGSSFKKFSLLESLKSVCSMAGVKLEIENFEQEWILAPQAKIESALINLVKNSKEANPDIEGLCIWASFRKDLVLRLNDGGDYLSIKEPEKIFERGFSSKSGDGRGIGLFSVKKTMKELGGDARLENAQGKVCFCLVFPGKSLEV